MSDEQIPKPGEIWIHEFHGRVVILWKFNWREWVCAIPSQKNRRAILARELLQPYPFKISC